MFTTVLKALLIHPNPLEREALTAWFCQHMQLEVIGRACCPGQLTDVPPDAALLVIFDYGTDSLSAKIATINQKNPQLKILIYSTAQTTSRVRELICAGVHGCLDVTSDIHESYEAVTAIRKGRVFYGQHIIGRLVNAFETVADLMTKHPTQTALSTREKEILVLVAREYSTARIATELFISIKTVETHRHNLFQKLQVKNVVGLTKAALRMGVLG